MSKQEALELLEEYARTFIWHNERDADYRNTALKEVAEAVAILKEDN